MTLLKYVRRIGTNTAYTALLGAGLATGCTMEIGSEDRPSEREDPTGTLSEPVSTMHETRPLLLVVMKDRSSSTLAQTFSWYNAKVFGSTKPYVTDYFSVTSRGRFKYPKAGAYEVTNPRTSSFDQRAGVASGDSNVLKAVKRARMLAADAGFRYGDYDANGDGTIDTSELTVLVISDALDGGKFLTPCVNHSGGLKVCSGSAYSGDADQMQNVVHELAHSFGPDDMYGAWNVSCHSMNQTIMSCTSNASTESWHNFDPWHRYKLGWTVNGLQVSGASGNATLAIVHEASTFGKKYEYIKLVNTASTRQSLILERRSRTGTYDKHVAVQGVVAWYVHEHSNAQQIRLITSLEEPPKDDKANFVLAPVNCVMDPLDPASRGLPGELKSGSSYRFKWQDGSDSGYLISVGSVNSEGLVPISYQKNGNSPSCTN